MPKLFNRLAVLSVLSAALLPFALGTSARGQGSIAISDPTAPIGSGGTSVTTTSNGTTQVNVSTPGADGTSMNSFEDFNVGDDGVVISNSGQSETSTQGGGTAAANPNIYTGQEAETIIFEVVGVNQAVIEGWVEILGPDADLIIASSAGLTCDGCAFYNVKELTLAAASVEVLANGEVAVTTTGGSKLIIGRGGLDASGASGTTLVGSQVSINGDVDGGESLTIIGGDNTTVNTNTGQVAGGGVGTGKCVVDATEYGAMTAGQISIVGTNRGDGVCSIGTVTATGQQTFTEDEDGNMIGDDQGSITIQSQGDVEIQSAEAFGNDLTIDAEGDVTANGDFYAGGGINISGENVALSEDSNSFALGDVNVSAESSIDMGGQITTIGDLNASAGDITAREGVQYAQGDITLAADNILSLANVTLIGSEVTLNGTQVLKLSDTYVSASQASDLSGGEVTLGGASLFAGAAVAEVTTTSGILNVEGIFDTDSLDVLGLTDIRVEETGLVYGATDLDLSLTSLLNQGQVISGGDLSLELVTLTNEGLIQATGDLDIIAETADLLAGGEETLAALVGNMISLDIATDLLNEGIVQAAANLSVDVQNDFTNNGTLFADGGITVLASNYTSGEDSVVQGANIDYAITGALANAGQMLGQSIALTAGTDLLNAGTIQAVFATDADGNLIEDANGLLIGGSLALTADVIQNDGAVISSWYAGLNGREVRNSAQGTNADGTPNPLSGLIQAIIINIQGEERIENAGTIEANPGSLILQAGGQGIVWDTDGDGTADRTWKDLSAEELPQGLIVLKDGSTTLGSTTSITAGDLTIEDGATLRAGQGGLSLTLTRLLASGTDEKGVQKLNAAGDPVIQASDILALFGAGSSVQASKDDEYRAELFDAQGMPCMSVGVPGTSTYKSTCDDMASTAEAKAGPGIGYGAGLSVTLLEGDIANKDDISHIGNLAFNAARGDLTNTGNLIATGNISLLAGGDIYTGGGDVTETTCATQRVFLSKYTNHRNARVRAIWQSRDPYAYHSRFSTEQTVCTDSTVWRDGGNLTAGGSIQIEAGGTFTNYGANIRAVGERDADGNLISGGLVSIIAAEIRNEALHREAQVTSLSAQDMVITTADFLQRQAWLDEQLALAKDQDGQDFVIVEDAGTVERTINTQDGNETALNTFYYYDGETFCQLGSEYKEGGAVSCTETRQGYLDDQYGGLIDGAGGVYMRTGLLTNIDGTIRSDGDVTIRAGEVQNLATKDRLINTLVNHDLSLGANFLSSTDDFDQVYASCTIEEEDYDWETDESFGTYTYTMTGWRAERYCGGYEGMSLANGDWAEIKDAQINAVLNTTYADFASLMPDQAAGAALSVTYVAGDSGAPMSDLFYDDLPQGTLQELTESGNLVLPEHYNSLSEDEIAALEVPETWATSQLHLLGDSTSSRTYESCTMRRANGTTYTYTGTNATRFCHRYAAGEYSRYGTIIASTGTVVYSDPEVARQHMAEALLEERRQELFDTYKNSDFRDLIAGGDVALEGVRQPNTRDSLGMPLIGGTSTLSEDQSYDDWLRDFRANGEAIDRTASATIQNIELKDEWTTTGNGGLIEAGGNLSILADGTLATDFGAPEGTGLLTNQGRLVAGGTVNIKAQDLINGFASVDAALNTKLGLTEAGLLDAAGLNAGTIYGGSVAIDIEDLAVNYGTLVSEGYMGITAGAFLNQKSTQATAVNASYRDGGALSTSATGAWKDTDGNAKTLLGKWMGWGFVGGGLLPVRDTGPEIGPITSPGGPGDKLEEIKLLSKEEQEALELERRMEAAMALGQRNSGDRKTFYQSVDGTGLITGGDVFITTEKGDLVMNGGSIMASRALDCVTDEKTGEESCTGSHGDIVLQAAADIILQAKKSEKINTWKEAIVQSKYGGLKKKIVGWYDEYDISHDYDSATVAAGGKLRLIADDAINVAASQLGGYYGADLIAGGDITISSVLEQAGKLQDTYYKAGWGGLEKTTKKFNEIVSGPASLQTLAGDLSLYAGYELQTDPTTGKTSIQKIVDQVSNIRLAGATVQSGENLTLKANGGGITLDALTASVDNYAKQTDVGFLSYSSVKGWWNSTGILTTQLISNANLSMAADQNIEGVGAYIAAAEDLTISTPQDVLFTAAVLDKYYREQGYSVGIEISYPGKAIIDALQSGQGLEGIVDQYIAQNPLLSSLKGLHDVTSDGRYDNLSRGASLLNAISETTSLGAQLASGYARAGKDLEGNDNGNMNGLTDVAKEYFGWNPFSGFQTDTKVHAVDENGEKQYVRLNKETGETERTGVPCTEAETAEDVAVEDSCAIAWDDGKTVSWSFNLSYSKWNQENTWQEATNSYLVAGADAIVNGAFIALDGGTQLAADDDIVLTAADGLLIKALGLSSTSYRDDFGLNLGVSMKGFDATTIDFSANGSKSAADATTYTNAVMVAGAGCEEGSDFGTDTKDSACGILRLDVAGDFNIIGGNVHGKVVDIDVDGDLNLISLQNTSSSKSSNWGFNISYDIQKQAVTGLGASYGEGESDRAWADRISSITSSDGLTIDVTERTALLGSLIASATNNMTLTTNELAFEHLENWDRAVNSGWGFQVSIPDLSEGSEEEWKLPTFSITGDGKVTEGVTYATIGGGTISILAEGITDTNTDFPALNDDQIAFLTQLNGTSQTSQGAEVQMNQNYQEWMQANGNAQAEAGDLSVSNAEFESQLLEAAGLERLEGFAAPTFGFDGFSLGDAPTAANVEKPKDMSLFEGNSPVADIEGALAGLNRDVNAVQEITLEEEWITDASFDLEAIAQIEEDAIATANLMKSLTWVPPQEILDMGKNAVSLARRYIAGGLSPEDAAELHNDPLFVANVRIADTIDELVKINDGQLPEEAKEQLTLVALAETLYLAEILGIESLTVPVPCDTADMGNGDCEVQLKDLLSAIDQNATSRGSYRAMLGIVIQGLDKIAKDAGLYEVMANCDGELRVVHVYGTTGCDYKPVGPRFETPERRRIRNAIHALISCISLAGDMTTFDTLRNEYPTLYQVVKHLPGEGKILDPWGNPYPPNYVANLEMAYDAAYAAGGDVQANFEGLSIAIWHQGREELWTARWNSAKTVMYTVGETAIGFIPLIGDAQDLVELVNAVRNGDLTGVLIAGVGFIPFAGEIAQGSLRALERSGMTDDMLRQFNRARRSARDLCSFHGDTLVLTESGLVAIRDVSEGQLVWSKDEVTGEVGYQGVTAHYSNEYNETVSVTVSSGGAQNISKIVSNRIHPFFIQTNRSGVISSNEHNYQGGIPNGYWVDAGDLKPGDNLLNADGTWSTIMDVEISSEKLLAYNLTVSNFHTYFVSGGHNMAPVWVHNDCFNEKKLLDTLNVNKRTFHKTTKAEIKSDFNKELKKTGVKNPDIGQDEAGNIIFRDPRTGDVILRTDTPLSSYASYD